VGKSKEINLEVSSDQQGVIMEEDHRSILIIRGIQIFLPISPIEASAQISSEVEEKG
jgi:hypothetical protein